MKKNSQTVKNIGGKMAADENLIDDLRSLIERQSAQISALQRKVKDLEDRGRADGGKLDRRSLLKMGAAMVASALALQSKPAEADTSGGIELYAEENFTDPVTGFAATTSHPPLSGPVTWTKAADSPGLNGTNEILSLIFHATANAPNVIPYPLYVQLTTASPNGNQVGINSTLFQQGASSNPWAATVHVEPHQQSGSTSNATLIGVNVETTQETGASGRTIGVNILAVGGNCSQAINIQTGAGSAANPAMFPATHASSRASIETGIRFEANAAGGKAGGKAIWIEGKYDLGLDMEDNHIKLNTGARIYLDTNYSYYLRLNPRTLHLEFCHNATVLKVLA